MPLLLVNIKLDGKGKLYQSLYIMGPYHKAISLSSYFLKGKIFLFMFGTLENGKSSQTAKQNIYIIKQYKHFKAIQSLLGKQLNNKEKIFIIIKLILKNSSNHKGKSLFM